MPIFNDNIRAGSSNASDDGYKITHSLRWDKGSNAYLYRTCGTPTNQTKISFSTWVKHCYGEDTSSIKLIGGGGGTQNNHNCESFAYYSSNNIASNYKGGLGGCRVGWYMYGTNKYRDQNGWSHVMVTYDNSQSGDSNKLKFYINGVQDTLISCGSMGAAYQFTNVSGQTMYMGRQDQNGGPIYTNVYQAETYFVDGTVYTPSDFTETNSDTGVLVPLNSEDVLSSISLGNNGGYYNYSDSSDIGKDHSSNSNDFTASGFSTSAGDGNDQKTDTPTNNKATLNPATGWYNNATLSEGNLEMSGSDGFKDVSTIGFPGTSKFYYEVVNTSAAGWQLVGIWTGALDHESNALTNSHVYGIASTQATYYGGSYTSTTDVPAWSTNDVMGIKYENGTLKFYKNGTLVTATTSSVPTNETVYAYIANDNTSATAFARFSVDDWTQATAAGVDEDWELSTNNLPTPAVTKPSDYVKAITYSGNGGTLAVTGVGFQPDFTWIKSMSGSYSSSHYLVDDVRATSYPFKRLNSDDNAGEGGTTDRFMSFDSDGFTVKMTGGGGGFTNGGSQSYVAWNWKEDAAAGFDIVTHNVDQTSTDFTISHNLGVTPAAIFAKNRDSSHSWRVFHHKIGTGSTLFLDTQDYASTNANRINAVSSSNFTFRTNTSGNFVFYVFAELAGFSKFGTYKGNSSTSGPFIYTGFKPAIVIMKKYAGGEDAWEIKDNARAGAALATGNPVDSSLYPNTSANQANSRYIDFYANGFRQLNTNGNTNSSGDDYAYFAWAESPFNNSSAR